MFPAFGVADGKSEYRRPPPADMLPLHDPRLMKKGGAHDPDQIGGAGRSYKLGDASSG